MDKLFVSTLSNAIAERDDIVFQIENILEDKNASIPTKHRTSHLKNLFKKLSTIELTIETIQVYYAKNQKQNENNLNNKKDDNNT